MSRSDNNNQHHHRHRSGHSRDRDRDRDRDRRSHHGSHSHRDSSHHSRSYHDSYSRSSSSIHSTVNHQQMFPLDQSFRQQMAPPIFVNEHQYPPEAQQLTFNPAMMPPGAFPLQPYVHHQNLPFDLQSMPPGLPNLPFQGGLDEKSISASALERLQLPQDKITETGIIPNNPYYDLPAGLMVPLVPANRVEYKPIDPKDLRLPFPKFPDENFLRMIDSYYSNDSARRDNDGWDRNFIELYTKQKEALAKMESETSQ